MCRSVLVALLSACAAHPAPTVVATRPVSALVDPELVLIATPSPDHRPFVDAIDGAATTIDMTMFHLTDPDIVAALARAVDRGVHVRAILDRSGLATKKLAKVADELRAGGVDVRGSSAAFSITHEKAMVVDGKLAFITAINLTKDSANTRDFGIVTRAAGVVADVAALFAADWDNAEHGGHATPDQREPSLVVSPTSSRAKLVALIDAARRSLIVSVENLGDPDIGAALTAAVKRGVAVRLIAPMCDKNPDPLYNFAPAERLAAAGVSVRLMPAPESELQPYMHSKMIQADAATTYVGSVNFSVNSTTRARELGVIFANAAAAATIVATFDTDWQHAVPPPAERPTCPAE